jgi:hypothetical protein
MLLLLSWKDHAREIGAFERDTVDLMNQIRAANSDRYLYAHIRHKRIEELAREFKDSKPAMTTKGFGPKRFAPIKVSRRSKKNT